MNLNDIFLEIKSEIQQAGSLWKLFNKTAAGENDKIPLFKFTEIMEWILNRGWETFPMEIDKFARLFMVAGSKSLISFTELEKEFFNRF